MNFRAGTQPGDRVIVLGAGPIGLCAMQEARALGAEVTITDLIDRRLERAAAMGAAHTVNAGKTDVEKWYEEYSGGDGADVVINTVGNEASLQQSVALAGYGGAIASVSLDKRPAALIPSEITNKELTIAGSRLSRRHFRHVVDRMEAGLFQPQLLRSHTLHFTQIREGLYLIRNCPEQVCKVALRFD